MGDSAPQPNAQNLRDILVGHSRFEQQKIAIQWARENHCVVDMFGVFAREHHLLLFQSGNESENWIDPTANLVYKMNTLMHVGGDTLKLFNRIEWYNELFPHSTPTPHYSTQLHPVPARTKQLAGRGG